MQGGREGHQFTGRSSLSVGRKTQNSEVLIDAWTTRATDHLISMLIVQFNAGTKIGDFDASRYIRQN